MPPRKKGTAERQKEAKRKDAARRTLESQRIKIPKLSRRDKIFRQRLERDNEAWIWEMFGPKSGLLRPLTRPFTSQDSDMIGSFFESLRYGGDGLTLCSRGGGKTTNLRECIVKALLTGVLSYGIYFGAAEVHAADTGKFIRYAIAESVGIQRYYPEVGAPVKEVGTSISKARGMIANGYQYDDQRKKFTDAPLNFQWSDSGITFPLTPGSPSYAAAFQWFGLDSSFRGKNRLGMRPDGCFIDDPDRIETVTNGEQAEKVIERINFDMGGLAGEGAKMCRLILATMSHKGEGVAFRLSSKDSNFVVKRHRFLLKKPDHWEMWQEYVDLRQRGKSKGDKYGRAAHEYYLEHRAKMDAGCLPGGVANPHRFDSSLLADGSQVQVSALQYYFDEWADKGEFFCRCELDNERVVDDTKLTTSISPSRMIDCMHDFKRGRVSFDTDMIIRAVDVRKTELHFVTLASDSACPHNIIDYDVQSHGTGETTVEQAEHLILDGLRRMADKWDANPYIDGNGNEHDADLTLIDIGWSGNWKTEDGEWKTWATQPVQTFCIERGLDRFLPARGMPRYQEPVQDSAWAKWSVHVGNNWYIKKGSRKQSGCDEVAWDTNRWHLLVEELFMLPDADSNGQPYADRFELFSPGNEPSFFGTHHGTFRNHKIFGQHITNGARELKEQMNTAIQSRKPKFVKDHWWDGAAMCLVGKSVCAYLRSQRKSTKPSLSMRQLAGKV